MSILTNISLYIGQLLIARSLSREEYALFLVVTNFVVLFSLFADLGLTPLFVRLFSKHSNLKNSDESQGSLLGSMIFIRVSASVIVSVAVVVVSYLVGYSIYERYLMAIFLASLFISSRLLVLRSVGEALLRSKGRYHIAMLFATLDAMVFALCIFIVRYFKTDVELTVWIYTFSNLPGFILLTLWISRWVKSEKIHLKVDFSRVFEILREGVPLALGTAFLTIHNTADTLLLDRLSTSTDVSAYGAGIRVLSALIFLPSVFALVSAPEITKAITGGNPDSARRIVTRSLQILIIISLLFALALTAAPVLVVTVLFGGDKFVDAAPLVTLFGWAFIGMSFSYYMIEVAIAEGKQWVSMLYMLVLMVVSVVFDLLLIRPYGFYGAGVAKTIAVVTGSIVVFFSMRSVDSFIHKSFFIFALKASALTLLLLGGLLLARSFNVNELFLLLSMLILFLAGVAAFKLLSYTKILEIVRSIPFFKT